MAPSLGNEASVSATDVWLTPPYILDALGPFDLDPCSPIGRPWDTAAKHYTIEDDGLAQEWAGRVWLNPPYGPKMGLWLDRLAKHSGGGVALVFARTETRAFFETVWSRADAILFLRGRVKFHTPDGKIGGSAGAPSVLIAYGKQEKEILKRCGLAGHYVELTKELE